MIGETGCCQKEYVESNFLIKATFKINQNGLKQLLLITSTPSDFPIDIHTLVAHLTEILWAVLQNERPSIRLLLSEIKKPGPARCWWVMQTIMGQGPKLVEYLKACVTNSQ